MAFANAIANQENNGRILPISNGSIQLHIQGLGK